ncbi:hypothetical protein ACFQ14_08810 [Pseudahrensia aquimaris]|uniref:Uncharacterized protein n=2 Tax=Pseudahrensia aquimaris TaxID=744461 RepID=A0ABW3FHZ0_9HYPH
MIRNRIKIVLFGITLSAFLSNANAQTEQSVVEVEADIDWENVQKSIASDKDRLPPNMRSFATSSSEVLGRINVPVLVPSGQGETFRSSPLIVGDGGTYAALLSDTGGELAVMGSSKAIQVSLDDKTDETLNTFQLSSRCDFQPMNDEGENSADCSFVQFGAYYTIRLTCKEANDEKCIKPDFLEKVREDLVTIGGVKK